MSKKKLRGEERPLSHSPLYSVAAHPILPFLNKEYMMTPFDTTSEERDVRGPMKFIGGRSCAD